MLSKDIILSLRDQASILPRSTQLTIKALGINRKRKTRRTLFTISSIRSLFSSPAHSTPAPSGANTNILSLPTVTSHTTGLSESDNSDTPLTHELNVSYMNIRSLNNKASFIHEHIVHNKLAFFALTETWLNGKQSDPIRCLATPTDYLFFDSPRLDRRGGGTSMVCMESLKPSSITTPSFDSFEHLALFISLPFPITILVIYRPPSSSLAGFSSDVTDLFSILSLRSSPIFIIGDININPSLSMGHGNPSFNDLLLQFDISQLITTPTHRHGNILDILASSTTTIVSPITISDQSPEISDHFLISCCISAPSCPPLPRLSKAPITFRRLSLIDPDSLAQDLATLSSDQIFASSSDPDLMIATLKSSLQRILDNHAPLIVKHPRYHRSCPWYTEELRCAKRERRRYERQFVRCPSAENRLLYKTSSAHYLALLNSTRESHSKQLIEDASNRSRGLFKLLSTLTLPPTSLPNLDAQTLADFFTSKITLVRSTITRPCDPPIGTITNPVSFNSFSPTSTDGLSKIVASSHKSSSPDDLFPASITASHFCIIAPLIAQIFNTSLSSGIFPSLFKQATIRPIIKKHSLDPNLPSSYRPISLLPFLSKILEKVVATQICDILSSNNLDEEFQSGFRTYHSTETALLRVSNDIRLAADQGKVSLLILLDLSAAFDTIDHDVLLNRLAALGISGTALNWFRSYLSERTQTVLFNNKKSSPSHVSYGVPQGSVLGPLLFRIYMIPLCIILHNLGVSFHCYADDTQIYLSTSSSPSDLSDLRSSACSIYSVVSKWLSSNYLRLNDDKTELMLFGPPALVERLRLDFQPIQLGSKLVPLSDSARNLGVIFDSRLSMKYHISNVVRSSFFTLRKLSLIRKHFSFHSFATLIHAFITSRLDYCNSMYAGAPQSDIRRLQSIMNYAARLLTFTRKRDHIQPVLHNLHWLPVLSRIKFKILTMVYRSLNFASPKYLSSLLSSVDTNRSVQLRSGSSGLLHVPRTRKVMFGDRAFSVVGPRLWNDLPRHIREADSYAAFKRLLKTHLFI